MASQTPLEHRVDCGGASAVDIFIDGADLDRLTARREAAARLVLAEEARRDAARRLRQAAPDHPWLEDLLILLGVLPA